MRKLILYSPASVSCKLEKMSTFFKGSTEVYNAFKDTVSQIGLPNIKQQTVLPDLLAVLESTEHMRKASPNICAS